MPFSFESSALKPEYIEKLRRIEKQKSIEVGSIENLDKVLDEYKS